MTIEFLTKANKLIEGGLRKTPSTGAPCPEQSEPEPDIEWNSTVGRVLDPEHVHTVLHGNVIEGIPFHAVPNREPCPWVCPAACLECPVKNCVDRLAGGNDEIP